MFSRASEVLPVNQLLQFASERTPGKRVLDLLKYIYTWNPAGIVVGKFSYPLSIISIWACLQCTFLPPPTDPAMHSTDADTSCKRDNTSGCSCQPHSDDKLTFAF